MSTTVSIIHRDMVPGTPSKYTDADVEFVKKMLKEAIDYLGGIKTIVYPGDKVVIKVNALMPLNPGFFTTDPRVVEALVKLIKEEANPKKIMIAEDAVTTWRLGKSTFEAFKACGIEKAAKRAGAELVALEDDSHVKVEIPNAKAFTWFMCPKTLMDADSIIYVPHLKVHMLCNVTLGMKLSQGIILTEDKFRCHKLDLHQKFADMLRVIKPDLVIVDGIYGTQRSEVPVSPEKDVIKDMNVIIAGKDVVATDAVAAAVMGFDPLNEVGMIRIAHNDGTGIGDLNKIKVVGKKIEEVKRQFARPEKEIVSMYPNVNVYLGGACDICVKFTRQVLDYYKENGILEQLPPINVILGFKTIVPDNISGPTFIIGDCTEEHKEKGIFYSGCPPLRGLWVKWESDLAKLIPP